MLHLLFDSGQSPVWQGAFEILKAENVAAFGVIHRVIGR
jgi:hypothetical protein